MTTPPDRLTEDHELFERYRRTGDLAARDALVARFLPLAKHLARRYGRDSYHADDLFQVASLGLLKAIDRFDADRGIAFSSFATPTIVGELKRYFRDKSWTVRVPRDLQDRTLNVQRAADELEGELGRVPTALRRGESVLAHLAQGALSHRRVEATRAVLAGWRDARRRRLGRRTL